MGQGGAPGGLPKYQKHDFWDTQPVPRDDNLGVRIFCIGRFLIW